MVNESSAAGGQLSNALLQELGNLLVQGPSNVQQLREFANREQVPSLDALAAWFSIQAGDWVNGLPFARRAGDAGIVGILTGYIGPMLNDSAHLEEGMRFLEMQTGAGLPVDPFAYMSTLLPQAQSRPDLVERFLTLIVEQSPAREQALVTRARDAVADIESAAATAETECERAVSSMHQAESGIQQEYERIRSLATDVGALTNDVAADHLGKEYAKHAESEETRASLFTRWSIIVGVFVALTVTGIAFYLVFSREHGISALMSKAALTLPFVAFAAYLGRLGTVHRRQAWRWRHIELQIKTAQPFVAPLTTENRETMTAVLAMRFFPGQRVDGDDGRPSVIEDPASAFPGFIGSSPPASPKSTSQVQGDLPAPPTA